MIPAKWICLAIKYRYLYITKISKANGAWLPNPLPKGVISECFGDRESARHNVKSTVWVTRQAIIAQGVRQEGKRGGGQGALGKVTDGFVFYILPTKRR